MEQPPTPPHDEATPAVKLTLFIGNPTEATRAAIQGLEKLVAEQPGRFTLRVINVNERPELAEAHRIIATPTLIRELPPPVRRLVGDLSRDREVRVALDVAAVLPPLETENEDAR